MSPQPKKTKKTTAAEAEAYQAYLRYHYQPHHWIEQCRHDGGTTMVWLASGNSPASGGHDIEIPPGEIRVHVLGKSILANDPVTGVYGHRSDDTPIMSVEVKLHSRDVLAVAIPAQRAVIADKIKALQAELASLDELEASLGNLANWFSESWFEHALSVAKEPSQWSWTG